MLHHTQSLHLQRCRGPIPPAKKLPKNGCERKNVRVRKTRHKLSCYPCGGTCDKLSCYTCELPMHM